MVNTLRKTKEKGQRTPRSLDVYQTKGGISGAAFCQCGAVFQNKRWRCGSREPTSNEQELVCPACRRIADQNPAGIVSVSGSFLTDHGDDIDNLIHNLANEAVLRNPLGRVMDIQKSEEGITITTTDTKLAQKIGRQLFKSFGGELQYSWSQGEDRVRVSWCRQT